ncbi:hypothetical protein ID853_18175 [Xenorhabdus sp. Vera]|uniref:hypothetical protein n=1 Tax=Xenorhabdus koppenhoeferi TaxID=351659 RepID=UPI0019C1499D|nr:hypothetical protein [Xenorhabdus sp. Vera]MBD2812745.1 hypothetical protein [Xenorhabdus sp. Vera]
MTVADLNNIISNAKEKSQESKHDISTEEKGLRDKTYRDDKARTNLTFHFVWGFFGLIIMCFIFVLLYNSCAIDWIKALNAQGLPEIAASVTLLELDKVLSVIIGALGTSLGFIIGYYFKEKKG